MNVKIVKAVVHGARILAAGALHALEGKVAKDLIARGLAVQAPAPSPNGQDGQAGAPLRIDGPTIEEWVQRGYDPAKYPPAGYAEKTSPGLMRFKAGGPVIEKPADSPAEPAIPAGDKAATEAAAPSAPAPDVVPAAPAPDAAAPKAKGRR